MRETRSHTHTHTHTHIHCQYTTHKDTRQTQEQRTEQTHTTTQQTDTYIGTVAGGGGMLWRAQTETYTRTHTDIIWRERPTDTHRTDTHT